MYRMKNWNGETLEGGEEEPARRAMQFKYACIAEKLSVIKWMAKQQCFFNKQTTVHHQMHLKDLFVDAVVSHHGLEVAKWMIATFPSHLRYVMFLKQVELKVLEKIEKEKEKRAMYVRGAIVDYELDDWATERIGWLLENVNQCGHLEKMSETHDASLFYNLCKSKLWKCIDLHFGTKEQWGVLAEGDRTVIMNNALVGIVCHTGDLDGARWMILADNEYEPSNAVVELAFRVSCTNFHLEMANWWMEKYPVACKNALFGTTGKKFFVSIALTNGQSAFKMMEWLYDEMGRPRELEGGTGTSLDITFQRLFDRLCLSLDPEKFERAKWLYTREPHLNIDLTKDNDMLFRCLMDTVKQHLFVTDTFAYDVVMWMQEVMSERYFIDTVRISSVSPTTGDRQYYDMVSFEIRDGNWKKDVGVVTMSELENCLVCLETKVELQINCGHLFCDKCITQWKYQKGTCPCCRVAIVQCNRVVEKKAETETETDASAVEGRK